MKNVSDSCMLSNFSPPKILPFVSMLGN